jgi:YVTN family beta-propeller protein
LGSRVNRAGFFENDQTALCRWPAAPELKQPDRYEREEHHKQCRHEVNTLGYFLTEIRSRSACTGHISNYPPFANIVSDPFGNARQASRRQLVGVAAINFIDTATNTVKHVTYVGRSPHEAFLTPDGSEVWVTVRGENYVSVLDGTTYMEKARITVPNGPGMTIFSPDGTYGYVCSSFTPETVVIAVATHAIVGRVPQASPFCPNIAATPDGTQVWFTLKDTGKTQVFDAQLPFTLLKRSTPAQSRTTSTSLPGGELGAPAPGCRQGGVAPRRAVPARRLHRHELAAGIEECRRVL